MIRTRTLLLSLLLGISLLLSRWMPAQAQPSTGAPSTGDLVITEIHFAPSPSSNEFVEILNISDWPIDLQAVTLADGNLHPDPLATEPSLLAPGARAVLVRDPAAFDAAFPDVTYRAPGGWDALNNGGDLVLLQHGPTVLDAVEYDSRWATIDGASLERIDPAAPSDAFNFASSVAELGATPGAPNSVYAPDREAPRLVFAEETGPQVVEGVFSEPVTAASLANAQVGLDGQAARSTDLVSSRIVRVHHAADQPPSRLSIAGVADRSGNRAAEISTPVARRPAPGDVVINELLPAPRADDYDDRPNQPEYVELLNRTPHPLSLRGLRLSDRPREDGTADTLRAGDRLALPPRGYAVVFAAPALGSAPSPDDLVTASLLARAFPQAPLSDASVALLPVDKSSLGLRNRSDVVQVHRADGLVLDRVAYDADWHADALDTPTGSALERISPTGPSSAADNWTSSAAPEGGTPGSPNTTTRTTGLDGDRPRGRGLDVAPSPFSAERDGATRIRYELNAVASVVRVRIYDARGRRVRTLTNGQLSGPQGELVWNGRGDDGERLRVGLYVVLLDAVDSEGGTVERHKAPVVLARPLR